MPYSINDKANLETLTLIIHGTFAADESWWKPGHNGESTFADRLESALERKGFPGTVWNPTLMADLDYRDFSWSGKNLHTERVKGARKLCDSLSGLATKTKATVDKPLTVNIVAHSHGGNVALEALKHLDPRIRIGKVALMGTPLMSFVPSLRIVRLLLSCILLLVLIAVVLSPVVGLLPSTSESPRSPVPSIWLYPIVVTLGIVMYGWVFWLLAFLADWTWRILSSPILALRGRWNGQSYGPSARNLQRVLQDKKILLLTSYQDEAELMLKLGSAPRRLYVELINSRWSKPTLWNKLVLSLERICLRPIIVGLFFRVSETVLERFALGFPWLQVLFFDFEMADLKEGKEYPSSLLDQRDVTEALLPVLVRKEAEARHPSIFALKAEKVEGVDRHVATLRDSLAAVIANISHQIKLRHSLYYESPDIVDQLANAIVSESVRT